MINERLTGKNAKGFILVVAVLFLSIFLLTTVSAQYQRAFVQTSPFNTVTGTGNVPLFDRNQCQAGQDFILQVNPLGCTPSVVRSDLLEDQNVPVFCPIVATQINPLIDVDAINTITVTGQRPPEVEGIGYFPAKAALGKGLDVNTPVLNNLGYALIVLRRQQNESAIPDFIEGNLTARIRYDIRNAFGVGQAVYYLPELTDQEFNRNFVQYGFWEGRGFLRAESIDNDGATISIYSDREFGFGATGGEGSRIASFNLDVGETSNEIFMPGFNFCQATMRVKLNGLENPDTVAKLRVNEDVFEVKEGEKFLENNCQVRDVAEHGIVEKVTISCDVDEGDRNFNMIISPKVKLTVNNQQGEYSLGDRLFVEQGTENSPGGTRSVYLVRIATKDDTLSEKNLTITVAAVPGNAQRLDEDTLNSIGNFLNRYPSPEFNNIYSAGLNILKAYISGGETVLRRLIDGQTFRDVDFSQSRSDIFGGSLALDGFAGAVDVDFPSNEEGTRLRDNYENALENYETVRESYSTDTYEKSGDDRTLGEQALYNLINLALELDQKRTALQLCEEFGEVYPDSVKGAPNDCENIVKLSSPESAARSVVIDGRNYLIAFDAVNEPTFEQFGARILVRMPDGTQEPFQLRKNQILYLNETLGESIRLVDLDTDSARLDVRLRASDVEGAIREAFLPSSGNLRQNFPETFNSRYLFTLEQVNLKKVAKVSVEPNIKFQETTADFNFKIGVEKRAIQLSPEQTRDRIDSLNNTLDRLRNINDGLGKVVSGFKTACLGVGTGLILKNFVTNLGGEGLARQKVMRGNDGWFEFCENEVSRGAFRDVDSCLLANNDAIEASVDEVAEAMDQVNERIEMLREVHKSNNALVGEGVIDSEGQLEDFVDNNYRQEVQGNLQDAEITTVKIGTQDVAVSEIINEANSDTTFLTQARDLLLNSRLVNSDDENVKRIARAETNSILEDIYGNSRQQALQKEVLESLPAGLDGVGVGVYSPATSIKAVYTGGQTTQQIGQIPSGVPVEIIVYKNERYYVQLERVGPEAYRAVNIYNYPSGTLIPDDEGSIAREIKEDFHFEFFDRTSYQNPYIQGTEEVRYYETGEYAGLPAIVPFDINDGWYAATKSTLPIGGNIKAFDASGRVSSFWLCNIGKNRRPEFDSGIGDDICQQMNLATGQPVNQFHGLDEGEASQLVSRAVSAIEQASRAHGTGNTVSIQGRSIPVGEPYAGVPGIQCQDFMSATECNLLFNVCDPVVCPSSRCNLDGNYPVRDVVQSGIAGSLALCLPNFPEVKVPICLSGVHAGIDAYSTILDSYQQCLQTSLDTGQTVGICDELNSIYMCEFFWRQGLPIVRYAAPQVIGSIAGQSGGGGGEYLSVQNAFDQAEGSVDFFTQFYAANSFDAFKARTADGVGTAICQNWVSLTAPDGGSLFDALIAPDSPAQFYGRFDEIPFTTVTNPPTSQYKVFYHIYAGLDFPAQYQVYLKGPQGTFFQDTDIRRVVAQDFIAAGQYATQTVDLTAPTGYNELCIVVNGQEECGFKQVTTDFGLNFLTDEFVASEASRTDITTEASCISGTPNIRSLLSPNLQAGAEEVINPAIYNRGITRFCATDNPGLGSDSLVGTNMSRWQQVGFCGDTNVKCWLDTDSVRDAVRFTNIENEILGEVSDNYLDVLRSEGGFLAEDEFDEVVKDIQDEKDFAARIEKINQNIGKVFFNNEKGFLTLLRADAYGELAKVLYNEIKPTLRDVPEGEQGEDEEPFQEPENFEEAEAVIADIASGNYPILQFRDGLVNSNLYYVFYKGEWFWSLAPNMRDLQSVNENSDKIIPSSGRTIEDTVGSEDDLKFIESLRKKNYPDGLLLLLDRTTKNQEGGFLAATRRFFGRLPIIPDSNAKLETESVEFFSRASFKVNLESGIPFYFRNIGGLSWEWSVDEGIWNSVNDAIPETVDSGRLVITIPNDAKDLIDALVGQDPIEGAEVIFSLDTESPLVIPDSGTVSGGGVVTAMGECSDKASCQKAIGQEIIELATEIKQKRGISDSSVQEYTGLRSFECLALQVAHTESNIIHCGIFEGGMYLDFQRNGNPLYCDGTISQVVSGDGGSSIGTFQINSDAHEAIPGFKDNVEFGINLLADEYEQHSDGENYHCYRPEALLGSPVRDPQDFQSVLYEGWEAAIRGYNGYNTKCSEVKNINGVDVRLEIGNPRYVDDVLSSSRKSTVKNLFPEVC